VQGRHYGIGQLPQLAGRQLCAPGDILGVEGEQVVGGDEGLVERGQQVRVGPSWASTTVDRAAVVMWAALRTALANGRGLCSTRFARRVRKVASLFLPFSRQRLELKLPHTELPRLPRQRAHLTVRCSRSAHPCCTRQPSDDVCVALPA
jgi:hypothetical protein